MKYLVIKGWLGFGDRLESLKMGIKYALDNDLAVYVDWTDTMWSHSGESFYTYFKLINIKTFSLSEIPSDATYYPEYWKTHIHEPIHPEIIKDRSLDLGVLNKQYPADVIVLSNVGRRLFYSDSTFFSNVFRVIDSRVLDKIKDRLVRIPFLRQAYGIHVRGTDRINKKFSREHSVQLLAANMVMHGGLNGEKMIVVSDDKQSALIWKRFFPGSLLLSELSIQVSSTKGNHNLSKEILSVNKDEMNVDLLVDFFTLALTKKVISTSRDSRFANEASRLHSCVDTLLKNE